MLLTKPNELTVKLSYAGLIYGQPGVGKTTLALSSVNPVCIDADRGTASKNGIRFRPCKWTITTSFSTF